MALRACATRPHPQPATAAWAPPPCLLQCDAALITVVSQVDFHHLVELVIDLMLDFLFNILQD